MVSHVFSAAVHGIDIIPIKVEADVSDGLPQFIMVGDLASSVREASDRVRTAFRNSGISMPVKRITVNLSPADVPKSGSRFDLPIALSVIMASGIIGAEAEGPVMAAGELSLSGEVHPVNGIMPIAAKAREMGIKALLVPRSGVAEAEAIGGIRVVGISTLSDAVAFLSGAETNHADSSEGDVLLPERAPMDFSDIRGQAQAVRAALISASGFHNLLLIGPPGSGKTMIASRMPGIMPDMTLDEKLEVARIYSIAGLLDSRAPLNTGRPFRHPHHTVSPQALAGGGRIPVPGEITLAHRGVLFLDEFPEFQRRSLEILRQPLEDREITISRTAGTFRFPADFLLLAAMNPCPCGHFPDMNRCSCTPKEISLYQSRISRPLLDRIDMCCDCPQVSFSELRGDGEAAPSSAVLREMAAEARERQLARFKGSEIRYNSEIPSGGDPSWLSLTDAASRVLEGIFHKMGLSARSFQRILRVSRTIADLAGSDDILPEHVREAAYYRMMDSHFWRT